jgi:hypothetical protein
LAPGERSCGDARIEKTIEELAFEVPAGEAPAEFGKVRLKMPGRNTVVDTPEHSFDVGDDDVHPGELLGCGLRAPEDHPVVLKAGKPAQVGAKTVGGDAGPGDKGLSCRFFDLFGVHVVENPHKRVFGAFLSHAYPDEDRPPSAPLPLFPLLEAPK